MSSACFGTTVVGYQLALRNTLFIKIRDCLPIFFSGSPLGFLCKTETSEASGHSVARPACCYRVLIPFDFGTIQLGRLKWELNGVGDMEAFYSMREGTIDTRVQGDSEAENSSQPSAARERGCSGRPTTSELTRIPESCTPTSLIKPVGVVIPRKLSISMIDIQL